MSKKKDKDNSKAIPIDYQLQIKNLQYTIVLKDNEIDELSKENKEKRIYLENLENKIRTLTDNSKHAFDLENDLKKLTLRNEQLDKEIEQLNNNIVELKKKHEDEKKTIEQNYNNEIHHLQITIEAYTQKVALTNQLLVDKEQLNKALEDLKKEKDDIIAKNEALFQDKSVKSEIKFTNLKKKMTDNINQTRNKVTELNMQYMDVSTKLTLLQNHQLLIQLEYQSQQIDELKAKNDVLVKKVFDLSKDIEIHKEVELSLAEKSKNLIKDKSKSKSKRKKSKFNINAINSSNNTINTNNTKINEEDKMFDLNTNYNNTGSFNNINNINNSKNFNFTSMVFNNNSNLLSCNNSNNINSSSTNSQSRIINLEKKVINLEKKLTSSIKEYNILKDKNEFVEEILKNYETKYYGLFNFLEDCLNQFFNDDELKNNKEIYVNIDSIKNCDFTSLSKEEKYSTLIVLMKYLMPLLDNSNIINNNRSVNNINLKFHAASKRYEPKKCPSKIKQNKNASINANNTCGNIKNNNFIINESLPSIKSNLQKSVNY